jgi:hypothetical protein
MPYQEALITNNPNEGSTKNQDCLRERETIARKLNKPKTQLIKIRCQNKNYASYVILQNPL